MGDTHFDPIGLAVEPGTTVRFEIETGSHSATAYEDRIPSEADAFDGGTISKGGFEYTFETPGTYDYYCLPHQSMGMSGRIVVGEPGGPAEETPIPDGAVPASDDIVEQGSIGIDQFDASDGAGAGMMDGGSGSDRGGMRGSGSGMMGAIITAGGCSFPREYSRRSSVWLAGRSTGVLGGRTETPTATTLSPLETEYARGAIDEEEFRHRFDRLKRDK